jgi:drug/metabolite transporter (DMT)-like permease
LVLAGLIVSIVVGYGPSAHSSTKALGGTLNAITGTFLCLGISYFVLAVVCPLAMLGKERTKEDSKAGTKLALLAGAYGAIGALFVVLANRYGPGPHVVMSFVFGFAPLVNVFYSMHKHPPKSRPSWWFFIGIACLILGAVLVIRFRPQTIQHYASSSNIWLLYAGVTVLCWGLYGPTVHKATANLDSNSWKTLFYIGIAYLVLAVGGPLLLYVCGFPAPAWNAQGITWGLVAGVCGAFGAIGVILSTKKVGPLTVMPLIFGMAPIVNSFFAMYLTHPTGSTSVIFYLGILIVACGAALVLRFNPASPAKKPVVAGSTTTLTMTNAVPKPKRPH